MHSPLSQTGMKSMLRKKNYNLVWEWLKFVRLNVNYSKADYHKCCMIDNVLDKIPAHSPLSLHTVYKNKFNQ